MNALKMVSRSAAVAAVALMSIGAVVAPKSAHAQMNVTNYCQQSSPWGQTGLGTSHLTMASYGCATTSVSMVLRYLGIGTTPGDLNVWLTYNGGYGWDSSTRAYDLLDWGRAAQRGGGVRFVGKWDWTWTAADLNSVNYFLDRGIPVVAETRYGSARNYMHFVVLTGRSGSNYYMNDPIDGARNISFNARYGSPSRWIYSMEVYSR